LHHDGGIGSSLKPQVRNPDFSTALHLKCGSSERAAFSFVMKVVVVTAETEGE